ncbi:XVIPCD domain-containing protein [Lysobacter silvisoli]|uniref:X-Tfes XVIPCD domain-containing protein n=1 Tax=Lysobacter silvisoli TaxID=2293254 RepID=A0A371K4H7_9GAMM|nr:XVIPCD domain-containing protein [Lysobacter silvisoli]RDZ28826.1 hypothetical protein DX914_06865 [Lysobacter silvisoli]
MNVPADRAAPQAAAAAATTRQLTDAELRAVAYFAIGVGSEGSVGGRDVSTRLSFAGNRDSETGRMSPVGNSGYSIGTLQTDLGQHPEVIPSLLDAYQAWAATQPAGTALTAAERRQTAADLARDGNTIDDQNGRPMDARIERNLNTFLRSDAGVTYIHDRDAAQVDELMTGTLAQVRQTALYRNSTPDDQIRLAAMVAKVENQSGDRWAPGLLRDMNNGTHDSVADVNQAIGRMLRANGDYMETGRDATLAGAEVVIALRNADQRSPLHAAWQSVLADPTVNPSRLGQDTTRPNLPSEYNTIKELFLQKEQAPAFIDALDRGAGYAYGRPQREGNNRATAGLYAQGDEFVLWNRDGPGRAYLDGQWSEVSRNDLSRVRNRDGTTDLNITRDGQSSQLLHVNPRAPGLRAALDADTPVLPDRAEHPLLQQARDQGRGLDGRLGAVDVDARACLDLNVACLAAQNRFDRIDHVMLGNARQGQEPNVLVVQGELSDPARRIAAMPLGEALRGRSEDLQQRLDAAATPPAETQEQQQTQRTARSL